ncbi:MAG: carboxypeptidase-like regulatory domain-containing protein [Planctomycetaceae bacterium]
MIILNLKRLCHGLACGVLVSAALGCGGGATDTPELGEVSGVVTLDGAALEGATITFQPEEGRASIGVSDASGAYTLVYTDELNGAKVGRHTVTITTARDRSGGEGDQPLVESRKELLPAIYHSATNLQEEVKAGSQEINFTLQSTAPSA